MIKPLEELHSSLPLTTYVTPVQVESTGACTQVVTHMGRLHSTVGMLRHMPQLSYNIVYVLIQKMCKLFVYTYNVDNCNV